MKTTTMLVGGALATGAYLVAGSYFVSEAKRKGDGGAIHGGVVPVLIWPWILYNTWRNAKVAAGGATLAAANKSALETAKGAARTGVKVRV